MEKILAEFLSEMREENKSARENLQADIQQLREELLKENKKTKEELRADMQQLREELHGDMKQLKEELRTEMDERFDRQSKEIAQEFRNVVEHFEKKQRKQEKINRKVKQELKNNEIAQDAYDARIYKIEVKQSSLESRVYELEEQEKIAN